MMSRLRAVVIHGAVRRARARRARRARQGLISSERADVTIQPSDVNSLAEVKLNEAVVNSEVHIIRSRELMEQVARGLRVARTSGGVVGIANADNGGGDLPLGEKAHQIGKRLRVTPVRNANGHRGGVHLRRATEATRSSTVGRRVPLLPRAGARTGGSPAILTSSREPA